MTFTPVNFHWNLGICSYVFSITPDWGIVYNVFGVRVSERGDGFPLVDTRKFIKMFVNPDHVGAASLRLFRIFFLNGSDTGSYALANFSLKFDKLFGIRICQSRIPRPDPDICLKPDPSQVYTGLDKFWVLQNTFGNIWS